MKNKINQHINLNQVQGVQPKINSEIIFLLQKQGYKY